MHNNIRQSYAIRCRIGSYNEYIYIYIHLKSYLFPMQANENKNLTDFSEGKNNSFIKDRVNILRSHLFGFKPHNQFEI